MAGQLKLFEKRPKDRRGGVRARAGRPLSSKRVSHRTRPRLSRHHPVNVVVKIDRSLRRNLRARKVYAMLRRAFCHACDRFFRIIHYSVQGDHIHLIVEAADQRALSRGMQGFQIRVAKGLNKLMGGRKGTVFPDRYYAKQLTSPRYVRNALSYVLNNARRHSNRTHHREAMSRTFVDPCSSAAYFDGWRREDRKHVPLPDVGPPPVTEPTTWLLTKGWRNHHRLIGIGEVPGPLAQHGQS